MNVKQYRLPGNRELRIARSHQRVFVAIHSIAADAHCTSGPLALAETEIDALKSALSDVQAEPGTEESSR